MKGAPPACGSQAFAISKVYCALIVCICKKMKHRTKKRITFVISTCLPSRRSVSSVKKIRARERYLYRDSRARTMPCPSRVYFLVFCIKCAIVKIKARKFVRTDEVRFVTYNRQKKKWIKGSQINLDVFCTYRWRVSARYVGTYTNIYICSNKQSYK